jgi:hypothetical protein
MYLVKRVTFEEVAINRDELVTISQAAQLLKMTVEGVISAMNRGKFTEIIDQSALKFREGRRLLVKSEVITFGIQRSQ